MKFLYVLLVLSYVIAEDIADGEPVEGVLEENGSKIYRFPIPTPLPVGDLAISLTKYSDLADPRIYAKQGSEPTEEDHTWKTIGWSEYNLNIPEAELLADSDLYILVKASDACRFFIFLSYQIPVELPVGVELISEVDEDLTSIFSLEVPESETEVTIVLSVKNGNANLEVSPNREFTDSLQISELWSGGQYFEEKEASGKYYAKVTADKNAKYGILGTFGSKTTLALRASSVVSGTVQHGEMIYYKVDVISATSDLGIWVSTFSGNVQLYVKALQKPTTDLFDKAYLDADDPTMYIPSEIRMDYGAATGDYYIGIYGTEHSSYTIMAFMNEKSFTSVVDNLPIIGNVQKEELKYYYLDIQEQMENLEISVSVMPVSGGNPDLYVKLCKETTEEPCEFTIPEINDPQPNEVKYSGGNDELDIIEFEHNPSLCSSDRPCNYIIGVRGITLGTMGFTLTVSQSTSAEYILRNGYPMYMSAPRQSYRYYKYTAQNHTATKLDFILSSFSGSPSLYVSRLEIPTQHAYEKKSHTDLVTSDKVTYKLGDDGATLQGTYHIAVFSNTSSTFSILSQEHTPATNSTIKLSSGRPLRDTLYNTLKDDYRIYEFTVDFLQGQEEDIRISLSPLTGKYSLFVTNDIADINWKQQIFRWFWKDSSDSSEPENIITIPAQDPLYRRSGTYAILVNVTDFASDNSATYSMVYYTSNSIVTLIEDLPFRDQVEEGYYRYYVFPIQSNHKDFKVTVTATNGDPDIYVSLHPDVIRPDNKTYDFYSDYTGSDALTITWEGTLKDLCPDADEKYSHGDQTYCKAYIGVYGYASSFYTIKVHQSSATPSLLVLGQPQSGSLEPAGYEFYYFNVGNDNDLFIDSQPTHGISALYLTILDREEAGNTVEEWTFPIEGTADYAILLNASEQDILIPFEDLEDKCSSGACTILVTVFCPEINSCNFLLSASQDSVSTLVENEPKKGSVTKREYTYYKYYCGVPDNNLIISVTSLNGADPDLFVLKGRHSRPTKDSYQWAAKMVGDDSIMITPNDDFFDSNNTIAGTYIIGVYGNLNEITTYMISVNNHPTPIHKLIPGIPSSLSQDKNSSSYFYFFNDMRSDIVINLTPQAGSANFTVAVSLDDWGSLARVYNNLPTETKYTWTTSEDKSLIRISQSDPDFCVDCEFLIGVFTSDKDCSYSLTVKNDLMIQTLQNGIPVKGIVHKDQAIYYSYELTTESAFDIVLNTYSGDSDVYARPDTDNQTGDFIWHSETDLFVDHIRIYKNDSDWTLGAYTIKVFGFKDSMFSLVVHDRDSHITLIDGWPLFYSLEANPEDRVFFHFSADEEGNLVYCDLFPGNYYFRPTVYESFEGSNSTYSIYPGPDKYDKVYDYTDYDNYYGRLRMKNRKISERGKYVFGVYSYFVDGLVTNPQKSYNDLPGSFEIRCTSSYEISIIKVNSHSLESIPEHGSFKRFEITLPENGHFEVHISPCSGNVELMISKEWASVIGDELEIKTSNLSNGKLIGTLLNALKGTYYITVRDLHPDDPGAVSFEIRTIFAPIGESLHFPVSPGNQGALSFEEELHDKLKLSWDPVSRTINPVIYALVVTNDTTIKLDTFCAMTSAIERGNARIVAQNYSMLSAETHYNPDQDIAMNVYAMINDTDIEYVAYNPLNLKLTHELTPEDSTMNWIMIGVLGGVVLFAFVIAIYLYSRCKSLQRDLEYEQGDVRNMAARVEPGGYGPRRPQGVTPLSAQMDQ